MPTEFVMSSNGTCKFLWSAVVYSSASCSHTFSVFLLSVWETGFHAHIFGLKMFFSLAKQPKSGLGRPPRFAISRSDTIWQTVCHRYVHTHTHARARARASGSTHQNECSSRRRGRYLDHAQHTHKTNIYALSGIRTRGSPGSQAASDQRLRPYGHLDWPKCYWSDKTETDGMDVVRKGGGGSLGETGVSEDLRKDGRIIFTYILTDE
jgi:hypothetical protein